MALGTKPIAITAPQYGAFTVTSIVGQAGNNYPDTGAGASTTTAGNAHWEDLGLAVDEFEVEILAIIMAPGCTAILTELLGTGVAHYFVSGKANQEQTIGSTTAITGTSNPWGYQFAPGAGPRFRGGFKYTLSGAGGTIMYRIHAYHNKDAGY